MYINRRISIFSGILLLIIGVACGPVGGRKGVSNTTGWVYNDAKYGGFETRDYVEQSTPPGMVFIEGGTFTLGRTIEDLPGDWNNMQRRVTVNSFYMDQHEISNRDWREYLHWLKLVYHNYPDVHRQALPDTLVWQRPLGYNDPYVEYYFRHASFDLYPVVGVSWKQASDYCDWRTDRVNEKTLADKGIIELPNFQQIQANSNQEEISFNVFSTKKYLMRSDYKPTEGKRPLEDAFGTVRKADYNDGLLLPKFRLPTEAEWEYAAYGIVGDPYMDSYVEKRIYPWDGASLRDKDEKNRGNMMANFARGRGDLMGMAGNLNDGACVTVPVNSFAPNDWGLYNMAGNVNEWVFDVYRTTSYEVVDEFNPVRGNRFQAPSIIEGDINGSPARIAQLDSLGRVIYKDAPDSILKGKYPSSDLRNYLDGDARSSLIRKNWKTKAENDSATAQLYSPDGDFGEGMLSSRISNTTRVYKGGGWRDKPYWLNPSTRRYLDESRSRDDLGFRCAMDRVGSSYNATKK